MAINVVSQRALQSFWQHHPAARKPMENWLHLVRHATWLMPQDVPKTFNTADTAAGFTIFNVASYRIVADIAFSQGRLYIKHVFTHTEYDAWTQQHRGQ